MTIQQFKQSYYLERQYQPVSDVEFFCKIIVKNKITHNEITSIETKINAMEIGQGLTDSNFSFNPISWETFLNSTIKMLFNMMMLRIDIQDLYRVDEQGNISELFNEDPFHTE
jgi:hypothetical protein